MDAGMVKLMASRDVVKNLEIISVSRQEAAEIAAKFIAALEPVYVSNGQESVRILESPVIYIDGKKIMLVVDQEVK